MIMIDELIEQYYEMFKGKPSYAPIVRNNQKDDAFEVVVLRALYGKEFDFDFSVANAPKLAQYIISPPDNGIDIFFERSNGDDSFFDVIQVKNTALSEMELKNCFTYMERTIDDFCKNAANIDSDTCRTILSNSNLEKGNKGNCRYYVVHTGDIIDFSGSREEENVITRIQLEALLNNVNDKVEQQDLTIDKNNNTVTYNAENAHKAIICSINGYDLAELNNKYYSTEMGRNILFGQNLRESLNSKKNKTYKGMESTIINCPENFWFYNNGITIIADTFEEKTDEECAKVSLHNFSIVNGAQTTSSLGLFLKEAKSNKDKDKEEKLRKVFVLARILQVSDEGMRRDIAIYNNTQNPITSRDMVANRPEQKYLHAWLMDDKYPQIYVEIRRGAQIPGSFNKGITHRKTTNEELAQLAYAAFFQLPFVAKDKKSALFNNDFSQTKYTLNKVYHEVFNYDEENPSENGVLLKKTKNEIDEALFVQQLYKLCKRQLRNTFKQRIEKQETDKANASDPAIIAKINDRIAEYSTNLETVGVCMFYFISLYYEFKSQFSTGKKNFNVEKFYADKSFKDKMIEDAADLFLTLTIKLLKKTASEANKSGNINNWVRGSACQEKFAKALQSELSTDMALETKYEDFMDKYMVSIVD